MPVITLFRRADPETGYMSTGITVGIVVVAVLGLILLICVYVGVSKWMRNRRSRKSYIPPNGPHYAKRASDSGRLLEEPWLHESVRESKADLPLYNPHPSSNFQRPPAPHFVDNRRISISSSSSTPRPSSVIMMEQSSVPYMRELHIPPTIRSPSPPRSPKMLPPLVIPISSAKYASARPVAKMETPSSAVTSATSDSAYSQASASSTRYRQNTLETRTASPPPPVPPLPRPKVSFEPIPNLARLPTTVIRRVEAAPDPDVDLNRAPTKYIASLVKGRAKRAGGSGVVRSGTRVSMIERSNSISSVQSYDSDTSDEEDSHTALIYPNLDKTRAKWQTRARMETLEEVPLSTTSEYPFSTAPLVIKKTDK